MRNNNLSIITICFNSENELENTINSVLNQSSDKFEYIIVDGKSEDKSIEIIKSFESKFKERGITYRWISEEDKGVYDAMNKGLTMSKYEWVNFLNSGDELSSSFIIEKVIKIIEKEKESFFYSDTQLKDNISGKHLGISKADHVEKQLIHQSCIYKKELHNIYGKYLVKKGITISDYLFFNMVPNNEFRKINDIISIYDLNGISSNFNNTYYQKLAVDFLFKNKSVKKVFIDLLLAPLKKIVINIKKLK